MIWWLIGLGAAFYGYANGWGALIGVCPPGYQVQQDMFPGCVNNLIVETDSMNPLPAGEPTTAPTFPNAWAWNGTAWVQVPSSPRWP